MIRFLSRIFLNKYLFPLLKSGGFFIFSTFTDQLKNDSNNNNSNGNENDNKENNEEEEAVEQSSSSLPSSSPPIPSSHPHNASYRIRNLNEIEILLKNIGLIIIQSNYSKTEDGKNICKF
jgi:hypothetical protein